MTRASWDFHYVPVASAAIDDGKAALDLIVATEADVDPALISGVLAPLGSDVSVEPLLSLHPLYWTRVRANKPIDRVVLKHRVETLGVSVRYVASSRQGSVKPAPGLDLSSARPRYPLRWHMRSDLRYEDPRTTGRWFLGEQGVAVDREICGIGAGTRLAIIDNDAGATDKLPLDAEILVGVSEASRVSQHGALLAGLAIGAHPDCKSRRLVAGVAPGASLRLYVIPKAGLDVFTLPLALVRAADDGADVILCATYVEGQSSPMLDDALEFSFRLGRAGRGTAVVFPTGREIASADGCVHASLSLSLGDPASDPRAFCIGPSGRDGGWFLWRDRRARLRPFANRGPSVHWLAPGDDLACPLASPERLTHAESSGASGLAAGVMLLVLGINPNLTLSELGAVLTRTVTRVPLPGPSEHADVADPQDVLPYGRDLDGHDAKHGYGRLNAARACLAASDPFAQAMINMGEESAARTWRALRQDRHTLPKAYSDQLGAFAARLMLTDTSLLHATSVVARHSRLLALNPDRRAAHRQGALIRQLVVLWRSLIGPAQNTGSDTLATELQDMVDTILSLDVEGSRSFEAKLYSLAEDLWSPDHEHSVPVLLADHRTPVARRVLSKSERSDWKTA